ncbi:MAG TPA: hypothetical protein VF668_14590 [Pyrinomonadaceae bacterium]|jgi:hypothetical protein
MKAVDCLVGLRVGGEQKRRGFDRSPHGEDGYDIGGEPAFAPGETRGLTADFADGYAGRVALEAAAGD